MRKVLTATEILDNSITEKELKRNVEQAADTTGWKE